MPFCSTAFVNKLADALRTGSLFFFCVCICVRLPPRPFNPISPAAFIDIFYFTSLLR